ncbi:MAG TPA: DUF1254 domain-containing protein [Paraburkholderia sp.]|nr:DUF1254 domain-containing protein [Paraburkholderia sp.]
MSKIAKPESRRKDRSAIGRRSQPGMHAAGSDESLTPRGAMRRTVLMASMAAPALTLGRALMPDTAYAASLTPAEARAIAKDAYIYGYPIVDSYRILYSYFVDASSPDYKGAWNEIHNTAHVFTPDDKAMQTPNSDTPYSQLGLDLRTEPIVLTMPEVEKGRYYSAECNDLYTFIFSYIGSRSTGNEAGSFLIAGPHWKGEKPAGIKKVIRCETELAFIFYRTQLFNAADIENVKKIQAGYKVQPLSGFLGVQSPAAAPAIDFMKPMPVEEQKKSTSFFNELNFVLGFCPTHPSETKLMARFARLGIGASGSFDAQKLSPEIRKAVEEGMANAWAALEAFNKRVDAGEFSSADVFGSRAFLKNNYLYRMAGTVRGIWGNAKEEAIYPAYFVDASGQSLDGSKYRYKLRFAPGKLPPANAFWSLTMYELPSMLLTANPLHRYLINSPMLPNLKRDADGGLTLYLQADSPGGDKEANWLPAPKGPFFTALRVYWPKPAALDGQWKAPPLQRAS